MHFNLSKQFSVSALLLLTSYVHAGGPLVIEGPNDHTPVTYANPNLVLNLDPGPLGSRSNEEADILMQSAFALWNNVSTSTISLSPGGDLAFDIDETNFETVLPNTSQTELHENDGLNPVVYDSDGKIIDAFFGVGQSNNTVGFAASIIFIGQSNFVEGYAVINGKDLPGLTELDFKLLIAHELGHMFGLDHTQTNIQNNESFAGFPRVCQTSAPQDYAVMYPFICRNQESLHADDISAVSGLYPTASMTQNFGTLSGFFIDEFGNAILGANIWAENITTGEAISTVSDYLKQGNGFYSLLLPAGNYTLHANSINPEFNAGSAIGPYAKNAFDIAFQSPHPFATVTYQTKTVDTNGAETFSDAVFTVSNGKNLTASFNINGVATSSVTTSELPTTTTPSNSSVTPDSGSSNTASSGGGAASPFMLLVFLCSLLLRVYRKHP